VHEFGACKVFILKGFNNCYAMLIFFSSYFLVDDFAMLIQIIQHLVCGNISFRSWQEK